MRWYTQTHTLSHTHTLTHTHRERVPPTVSIVAVVTAFTSLATCSRILLLFRPEIATELNSVNMDFFENSVWSVSSSKIGEEGFQSKSHRNESEGLCADVSVKWCQWRHRHLHGLINFDWSEWVFFLVWFYVSSFAWLRELSRNAKTSRLVDRCLQLNPVSSYPE